MAGSKPFRGTGPIRLVYFTILLSHTVLATVGVVPLVGLTLTRALRRQFDRHAADREGDVTRSGSMSRSPAWSST